jgi:DNA mismatch endonuclease (patch repair protein)
MARIRGKGMKPELAVRRSAHALGYRFRLHRPDLPGKPDLTFPSRQKVIFVHGCFWHSHSCRRGMSTPNTNSEFWEAKRRRTVERDNSALAALEAAGWQTLVIWECETQDRKALAERLTTFLG